MNVIYFNQNKEWFLRPTRRCINIAYTKCRLNNMHSLTILKLMLYRYSTQQNLLQCDITDIIIVYQLQKPNSHQQQFIRMIHDNNNNGNSINLHSLLFLTVYIFLNEVIQYFINVFTFYTSSFINYKIFVFFL